MCTYIIPNVLTVFKLSMGLQFEDNRHNNRTVKMTLQHFVKKQTPILRHVNIRQEINPGLDLGKDRQLFQVRKIKIFPIYHDQLIRELILSRPWFKHKEKSIILWWCRVCFGPSIAIISGETWDKKSGSKEGTRIKLLDHLVSDQMDFHQQQWMFNDERNNLFS